MMKELNENQEKLAHIAYEQLRSMPRYDHLSDPHKVLLSEEYVVESGYWDSLEEFMEYELLGWEWEDSHEDNECLLDDLYPTTNRKPL